MARKKWIDKNNPTTQTFQLLYRTQNDPQLLKDENAGERALFAVGQKGVASSSRVHEEPEHKALHLADLEDDLDFDSMRDNEGEAAEQGIYFDDTSYDYMQHMRDLGQGAGDSHFVDALPTKVKGKKKGQTLRLEDALRQVSLDEEDDDSVVPSLVDSRLSTMSRTTKQRKLESQQDVPDEIAGFQPDMDPRLREVLEALEDDEYVDEKDEEDVFGLLTLDGKNNGELALDEFEVDFTEDDGWESDATEKAPVQVKEMKMPSVESTELTQSNLNDADSLDSEAAATAAAEDGDWLRDFAKYKRDNASSKQAPLAPQAGSIIAASAVQSQAPSLYTLNGTPLRQKKRKGAQTNPSAYSMTSSSLNRGDGLQLLDARFDQVEKMYKLDEADEFDDMDGTGSILSGMTGASKMSRLSTTSFADEGAVRSDFSGMMDEFLGDWNKANPGGRRKGAKGKRGKNGNEVYGLQQLEEVRRELGPARLPRKPQKA